MKPVVILLIAWFVIVSMATRSALADPDEKAIQRAMEQQRKAAEAEMRRQAEYEKKAMEQQQKAMQEQQKAEQRFVEQQQKILQTQQKALQNQQKAAQNPQKVGQNPQKGPAAHQTHPNSPHITTTQTSTPVYHAYRPYYGHHSGYAYHRTTYRNYRTMPTQVDPQTRAVIRLKASLDSVRMGSPPTTSEKTRIKRALMGVVEVPRVPTITSIDTLASHLANGLANRGSAMAQTGPMALTLRGAMNSPEFANSEVLEIMNEHRSALKVSRVRPTEITPIMESLKLIANQERSRR